MGAEDRMLRRPARHHNICTCRDCQPRKLTRERADDTRHTTREVREQLRVSECPSCGWSDYHVREPLGYRCTWCRAVFTDEET